MTISLLIDTSGGSNFENFHLRNVASLHVGGSALATETLDVTGTVGISSTLKVDTIDEFTSAAGVTVDGVVIKDSGATFGGDVVISNGFGATTAHEKLPLNAPRLQNGERRSPPFYRERHCSAQIISSFKRAVMFLQVLPSSWHRSEESRR